MFGQLYFVHRGDFLALYNNKHLDRSDRLLSNSFLIPLSGLYTLRTPLSIVRASHSSLQTLLIWSSTKPNVRRPTYFVYSF